MDNRDPITASVEPSDEWIISGQLDAAEKECTELKQQLAGKDADMKRSAYRPFANDVPLAGPEAPSPRMIEGVIRLLATIHKRFGNTCMSYSMSWGSNALHVEDAYRKELAAKDAEIEDHRESVHIAEAALGMAKAEISRLTSLLGDALVELKHYRNETGGCDHDANICYSMIKNNKRSIIFVLAGRDYWIKLNERSYIERFNCIVEAMIQ